MDLKDSWDKDENLDERGIPLSPWEQLAGSTASEQERNAKAVQWLVKNGWVC